MLFASLMSSALRTTTVMVGIFFIKTSLLQKYSYEKEQLADAVELSQQKCVLCTRKSITRSESHLSWCSYEADCQKSEENWRLDCRWIETFWTYWIHTSLTEMKFQRVDWRRRQNYVSVGIYFEPNELQDCNLQQIYLPANLARRCGLNKRVWLKWQTKLRPNLSLTRLRRILLPSYCAIFLFLRKRHLQMISSQRRKASLDIYSFWWDWK